MDYREKEPAFGRTFHPFGSTHSGANPRSRGTICPGCERMIHARKMRARAPLKRGRGECRVPVAPAASRACKKAHELVTTGPPESPGIPCAMVLTIYFVISPVIGLVCHRRRADMAGRDPVGPTSPPRDLTPASRRQDHTTSPSATRLRQEASPGLVPIRRSFSENGKQRRSSACR
jgi:hypothetical protein